ncbi:MAG: penicillin-insensitive murein endopeptidase [Alphaproteobacteria bacterium]
MRSRALWACLLVAASVAGAAAQGRPVKQFFGNIADPAPLAAASVGFYTKGCLAGGVALPTDGPAWQAMRLSRNRNWGTPGLVDVVQRLAQDARDQDGWNGLLVGDMSQPRGGPMVSGHTSHQTGLDVDIWFDPMPERTLSADERETMSATSYIKTGTNTDLDTSRWTEAHNRLIRRAALNPQVQRIFVNAGIKQELCRWAGEDRAWLRKIRPWYRHDDHLHMRLRCPDGMAGCKPQDPTVAGDGCGDNLAYWLSDKPYYRPQTKGPYRYKREMTLGDLPQTCRGVLAAGANGIDIPPGPYAPSPRLRPQITESKADAEG